LPGGGRAGSLAEAMITEGPLVERHLGSHATWDANVFAALGAAFVDDGAFVVLPAEGGSSTPIELLFLATTPGVMAHPRLLVVAGPHSRAVVIERYVGLTAGPYFTNAVTEIVAGPGAAVEHYVLQEQGAEAFHVATVHAALERDSAVTSCGTIFGGRLSRTTLTLALEGEGARGAVHGLYVAGGRQHVDHNVTVDHAVPRCASRQLFKGVLDGTARAVFNGRILVRQDAQKTDATQTNKHLLLSDGVEVASKPQLEIFADDVKCTHGAAEGQLAPEALFYLRSRGIGEVAARALLTYGFAREVLECVALEPLRAHVDRTLLARLQGGRAAKETA
jgi:Fe-S cluster assembly protein SufD